jgi:hypothetical protein
MIYKLFSPITGIHTTHDGNIDGAKIARQNLIAEGCAIHMAQPLGDLTPIVAQETQIASNYLQEKHGITDAPSYFYTVYNVDEGNQRMCSTWMTQQIDGLYREVKIIDGVVTEQYTLKPTPKGGLEMQALDLNSNEMIEYYNFVDKDLNQLPDGEQGNIAKFDANGNYTGSLSVVATYDELPEDKKDLLVDFPYKNTIWRYKESPDYGFVVHYFEQTNLPPTEAQIQAAKDEWRARWKPEFTTCEVTVLENGDEQWTPIDLGAA